MSERINVFTRGGKQFIYFDLSGFKTNDEFRSLIEESKEVISRNEENSVYTITNIKDVSFDSETKELVAKWTKYNKPYVKHGVVIGMDGIKKIMVNSIFAISGRKNMSAASTYDHAIEKLMQQ